MKMQFARRFGYWYLCLCVSVLGLVNISWWFHYHHVLPRDGFVAGLVAGFFGAMALAYRDVRSH